MRGQYEFDPAKAELDFGLDDSSAPAWELDLGGGHKLVLRGRIDRIDLYLEANSRSLCVVMDYKSSRRKLDPLLVAHGIQLQLLAYLAAIRSWPPEVWAGLNLPAFFSLFPPGRGEGEEPQNFGAIEIAPAGAFYVNLRGQYERGATRNEALADTGATRKRAYRHTGRFDIGALSHLDRAQVADQFNYRLNKDGRLRSDSVEALPRAEFEKLLDRVETQLREMGRTIFSGALPVAPYRKGRETPCAFCDYRAVCRMDPWTHRYRVLRATDASPAVSAQS
jgi:ATP-dependent helicase/nuclease subunit B